MGTIAARVYEALPSVLLGLNGPLRYEERRAAARSAKGGWARVAGARGRSETDASTSKTESGVGLEYRHRGHGVEVGLAGAWGEAARVGASLHHRRGSATVSQGGRIALHGTGAGVSGTRLRSEVDATWLRLGLNGVHATEDGRWTLSGGLGYATSGGSYELGGGLSLNARF